MVWLLRSSGCCPEENSLVRVGLAQRYGSIRQGGRLRALRKKELLKWEVVERYI